MPNAAPTITLNGPALEPLGGEIDVNAVTAGQQVYHVVEPLAGGGYVALWQIQVPYPYSLRAQVLDADGNRVGPEIIVEDVGRSHQKDIIPLANGGFAIVWTNDLGGNDPAGEGINARLYSSTGEAVTAQFMVQTTSTGAQSEPQIAELSNGNLIVTWTDASATGGDTSLTSVKGQLFSPDGTRIGGEFQVNTATYHHQGGAQVTPLADGAFVVAWTDASSYIINYDRPDGNLDVRAQLFDASGNKVGPEFLVPTDLPLKQTLIDIATLDDGKFVVTWDYYESDIRAQIFNADGTKFGGELIVATGPYDQVGGRITEVPGGFLVTWYDEGERDAKAQLYSNDGSKVGAEVVFLSGIGTGNVYITDVAVLPGGQIAISYQNGVYPTYNIYLQVFDATMNPIGGAIPVDVNGRGFADLTTGADGRLLAAYRSDDGDDLGIDAQLYAPVPLAGEGAPLSLKGLATIGDVDAGSGTMTVTLSVDAGTLDVTAGGSGAVVSGSGTGTVTITGTLAQINALLNSDATSNVTFTAPQSSPSEVILSITANDNGNSGGAAQSVTVTRTIDVVTVSHNVLYGTPGPDNMYGGPGNDTFVGYAGNDHMSGGSGSDTYYVEDAGDVVVDPIAEGVDRVAASVSYTLAAAADIEILEAVNLGGTETLNFIGNNFGQTIIGNQGANYLNGAGGPDTLIGLGGDDVLLGGPGDDAMHGGTGNDTFYIDSAGDQVFEAAGEGRDRVAAAVSFVLAAGVEVEVIEALNSTDTSAMDLAGNAFANVIVGNAGINVLDGGGGNDILAGLGGNDTLRGGDGDDVLEGGAGHDRMEGGSGSDTYYVDSDYDVVVDPVAEGVDRVAVSGSYTLAAGADIEILEALTLSDTYLMTLTGNEFGNTLIGNSGANTLDGKGGQDVLIGGAGADTFAFTTALGSGNVDLIAGFQSGADKIALSTQVFTTIAPGSLNAGAFVTAASAQDGDDRIIYDQATGRLFYDPDGSGAAQQVHFATIEPQVALSGSDFFLI